MLSRILIGGTIRAHRRNVLVLGGCAVAAAAIAAIVILDGELNPMENLYNTRGRKNFEMIPHPEQSLELMIKEYFQPLANDVDW